ncbi:MAG: hypothetical protein HY926_05185 [Elusimicrobia bacterium]|nr:hypothetical protein [Elusimicrobiota bacterium]
MLRALLMAAQLAGPAAGQADCGACDALCRQKPARECRACVRDCLRAAPAGARDARGPQPLTLPAPPPPDAMSAALRGMEKPEVDALLASWRKEAAGREALCAAPEPVKYASCGLGQESDFDCRTRIGRHCSGELDDLRRAVELLRARGEELEAAVDPGSAADADYCAAHAPGCIIDDETGTPRPERRVREERRRREEAAGAKPRCYREALEPCLNACPRFADFRPRLRPAGRRRGTPSMPEPRCQAACEEKAAAACPAGGAP